MINPMDLSGKTIIVTGASSGIGRETSILLSQLGARIILVARDTDRLRETLRELAAGDHYLESFDLGETTRIVPWVQQLSSTVGKIDGLVHSAGIRVNLPARLLTPSELDRTMRINVYAAAELVRGIRQKKIRGPQVSIVFLSSVMGHVAERGVTAYATSKGALNSLTRALAVELASENIRVNSVAPGYVRTQMAADLEQLLSSAQLANIESKHPLGIGKLRDVAHAVAFLLADTARWITGTTLIVDGGYTTL